jgi:hypothetical protein
MTRLVRFAELHGFEVQTHETCILVGIPYTQYESFESPVIVERGIAWFPAQSMTELRAVLGY